jgi:hypothetical protein
MPLLNNAFDVLTTNQFTSIYPFPMFTINVITITIYPFPMFTINVITITIYPFPMFTRLK